MLSEYEHRPRALTHYCLAAFVLDLKIEYPKNVTFKDPFDDNFDDDPLDPAEGNILDSQVLELPNGIIIKKRRVPRILRYVNYNIERDPENHYRERLMLFLPWRNEEDDLSGGFQTYEGHYMAKQSLIAPMRKKYEKFNDSLELAIEEAENADLDDMYDDMDVEILNNDMPQSDKDDYGFFDPDRPEEQRQYDIGHDMGMGETYDTEVNCSTAPMPDEEYVELMQSLNLRQSEICTHVIQWIQTRTEPMHIFIEGGAGVGKTKAAKAIHESMNRFYRTQPGVDPDQVHCIVLAPTGMAAYHVKGNTIHSGLHINISKDKLTPLTSSELNTLRSKYLQSKALFNDEISMVGRRLWNKSNQRLKEIFGTKKDFGGLHVIVVGDFFQMAPVRFLCV